ncbi:hypothetical protein ACFVVM_33035 [Nocardia sp. NPDC058176]|uniref:hypothetical protein n=1 Tax=Nocardia sp. NPDC058176 TaxID=3346368 RepID=UPI0036DD183C
MSLPTQQQIFLNALEQLDIARNALSEARDELNSDWAGVETGLGLPRPVGEHRTRVRAAITAAKAEIDTAKNELCQALEYYHPPGSERVLDDPRAEIADEQRTR